MATLKERFIAAVDAANDAADPDGQASEETVALWEAVELAQEWLSVMDVVSLREYKHAPDCSSCNDQGCPECSDEDRVWTRAR